MHLKDKILRFYKSIIFKFKRKTNLDLLSTNIDNLDELFNYFGSDKGTNVINPYQKKKDYLQIKKIGHGYGYFYENHLKYLRNKKINILEIGTWKGASAAAFYFYFKKAKIYCLDRNYKLIFRSKRLKFFNCNTTSTKEINNLDNILFENKENTFEVIIDDGSHIYSDILRNLTFFFKKVKSGGYYIIEDFNHYRFSNELNDRDNSSPDIHDILRHIVDKVQFNSTIIKEKFQFYCFDNISNITIHKGIQKDSFIAFIKKK
ncbi:class I SAM-dependent methyltransferase [Candidatus Pelagibacter sp.]|nr:class I SAM-dependent methyltransferase [Candidatus Pelagibacter sp.]